MGSVVAGRLHEGSDCQTQQLTRIEQGKDAAERAVRGDAIGQWQVLTYPVELHFAPLNNRRPAFRSADDGADRGLQQFVQLTGALTCPRIAQCIECV